MAGSPFGKYLLYERIAAGGMAEIYRAKLMAKTQVGSLQELVRRTVLAGLA